MSGQTTNGLPWPSGTELVRDGDNAIRALAEAVMRQYGSVRLGYAAGAVTTGSDGRVWMTVPGMTDIQGAYVVQTGSARWIPRPYSYGAPNLVLVEVLQATDGSIVPNISMGLQVFAWGSWTP